MQLLTESDYVLASQALGVEVATVKAVAEVESRGSGFLPSGKPKILFEGHKFSKFTQREYDSAEPTISYRKWTREHYKGGEREYERFWIASALDKRSALLSTSWGKFQIMGFNYGLCGYNSVENFVHDMELSEGLQLLAFIKFIENSNLVKYLKKKQWARFARRYNGKGYKKNKYDEKLSKAYQKYKG